MREHLKKYKTVAAAVLLAQLLVLVAAAWAIVSFTPRPVDIAFADWTSAFASFDNGFAADEETLGGKAGVFLQSPSLPLERGAYRLHISYLTDENQKLQINAATKSGRYLEGKMCRLSSLAYQTDYRFELTEADQVSFQISYNGEGALAVYDFSLTTDRAPLKRCFAILLFLFLAADIAFVFRKQLIRERAVLVSIAAIAVFATIPYAMQGAGWGHDIRFHLMRIESLAEEFSHGVFPVRMGGAWLYGYSYPASICYGDFLLCFPAVLRLFGFRILESYKCYVLAINLLTTITAYHCFREIFGRRREALILSLVYVTSTARLVAVFVRSAVGEYSAMMFIPLIALGLWRIYAPGEDAGRPLPDKKAVLPLGLGMAGVVCTHVLSTEMLLVVLVLLALLLCRRTFTPGVLVRLAASVGLCLAVSLFFLVPFFDYYLHTQLAVRSDYERSFLVGIQANGIWIGELFSFFHSPFGFNDRTHIDDRFLLTPGPILMTGLVAAVFYLIVRAGKGSHRRLCFLVVYASLVLLFATDLFPWNMIIARTPFGMLLAQVQFPYRYVDIAVFPLTLLLGVLLQELPERIDGIDMTKRTLYTVLIGISIVMTGSFISGYYKGMDWMEIADTAELNAVGAIDGGEYLLLGVDEDALSPLYRTEGVEDFAQISRDGFRHVVSARAVQEGAWIDFPVFAYEPGFVVRDAEGNRYPVTSGDENRMLRVLLPNGFSGTLSTDFVEPWYWRLSELVSLAALAGVAVWGFSGRRKKAGDITDG